MQPGNESGPRAGFDTVLGGDAFGPALARWAADVTVDDAARERGAQRWRRARLDEDQTFDGVLHGAAVRRMRCGLDIGPDRIHGLVVGMGLDFVLVVTDQAQRILVRTDAVTALHTAPGSITDAVVGDPAFVDVGLADVLGPISADRPEVLVQTSGGQPVRGVLRGHGVDVIEVRLDTAPRRTAWVRTATISSLLLDA